MSRRAEWIEFRFEQGRWGGIVEIAETGVISGRLFHVFVSYSLIQLGLANVSTCVEGCGFGVGGDSG